MKAYLARPDLAGRMASPNYDTLTQQERERILASEPLSFLHVVAPHVPKGHDRYQVFADNLHSLIEQGALVPEPFDAFYILELGVSGHTQRGLVVTVPASDYDRGVIKGHETTVVIREDEFVRYLDALRASPTPLFLVHRDVEEAAALVDEIADRTSPRIDVDVDGVHHRVWVVSEPELIASFQGAYAGLGSLYIADGHHRAAALARVARLRRESGDTTGPEQFMAAVLFPASKARILSFNRRVTHVSQQRREDMERRLRAGFSGETATGEWYPSHKGEALALLGDLRLRFALPPEPSDVAWLDAARLQDLVLGPMLGITDPRTDPLLEFIPGTIDITAVHDPSGVSFGLAPVSMEDLLAVSDAGGTMPPKSTLFDPKPRSGLIVRVYGDTGKEG